MEKFLDSSLKKIKKKAKFDVERIDEIEKEVKHGCTAFLTNLAENIERMRDLFIKA